MKVVNSGWQGRGLGTTQWDHFIPVKLKNKVSLCMFVFKIWGFI
jgi:hypothetical protein